MKVLAIGNSFSCDAMRYLHKIAEADGINIKAVNLYIGGCPLSRHYANMNNDAADYAFEFNGENTGIRVSIRQALQSDEWDIVTLQQVSSQSVDYDTYQPYLCALADYVRLHAPKAKLMLHQTWAYEEGSERLTKELGYERRQDMFKDIKSSYEKASESLGGAAVIPCGEAFEELAKQNAGEVHRDTFHASLGLGRFTLGCVWYETITGNDCTGNTFISTDEPITNEQAAIARACAHKAVQKAGGNYVSV